MMPAVMSSNTAHHATNTLTNRLKGNYQSRGVNGLLFLICGAIALLLASVGLYAVVAHAVTRRAHEMGIRTALGATSRHIRALVFRLGMAPLASGLAIGLAGALAVNRLLTSELVGVSTVDPASLLITSVMLILAATVGCWIPARRALRVDPLSVLMR
jgi:putative ABC transport system permease protein